MRKTTLILLLAATAIGLGGCTGNRQQTTENGQEPTDYIAALQIDMLEEDSLDAKYATELLATGTVAPDFALPTLAGDTLRLADFSGQWLVLDFWASWCPDCRKDLPTVLRLYETYNARGIAFAAISFDTDREAWQRATTDFGIPYPQGSELRKFHDTDIAAAYGVKWIPSLYLIAPDGRVALGTVLSDRLERVLQQVAE